MNKERRKRLEKVVLGLQDITADLEQLKDEEDTAYNNMPESLQESERGKQMYENIDKLDDAVRELESQIKELFEVD